MTEKPFVPRATRVRAVPAHGLTEPNAAIAAILATRGIVEDADRDLALSRLAPLGQLGGLAAAAQLILEHRAGRILIVGDFDADGATSTAVMLRCLSSFGFADVDFLVPNRFEFGYGLSPELVAIAAQKQPTLIITVDNGISSHSGVAAARTQGIDVLVTDHHLPPATLPDANVIVNPNLPGDAYPSKALAGVGVAFAVMSALARAIGKDAARVPAQYLDLVALGTVADVVPLDANNRMLVAAGLARISARQCCAGIAALLDVAGRTSSVMGASDLGFAVGPRLNAAGRLEDMSIGIRCLITDDPIEAQALARELHNINLERREIESDMQEQAAAQVAAIEDCDSRGCLVVHREDWHQGVVGLVASRLKEAQHKPVFAFASESDGWLKGSGRSVPGVHLRDLLAEVNRSHPGIIQKFGGHAMAAGLTLSETSLDVFRVGLDDAMQTLYPGFVFDPTWEVDGSLKSENLTLEFAEQLIRLGPWGQQFPEPLFEGEFRVASVRVVGEHHLKFQLSSGDKTIDGIAFGQRRPPKPEPGDWLKLVYRLDVNEWRGKRREQLVIEQWQRL